jgi:hypothetical protein
MNIWVDSVDHIRVSLNDLYMVGLMTGWMFLFMGIYYKQFGGVLAGLFLIVLCIWAIRTQAFITQKQFIKGMIPHHSMAIHMSKQLLAKDNTIRPLLQGIIEAQTREITFMNTL